MAIKKTLVVSRFGDDVSFANAYCSIQDVLVRQIRGETHGEQNWVVEGRLRCYISKSAKNKDADSFLDIPIQHVLESVNLNTIFSSLYAAVKADPRFIGATDD